MGTHVAPPDPIPPCDVCGAPSVGDFKTVHGPWGNLCEEHFAELGAHYPDLGTGKGQRWEVAS